MRDVEWYSGAAEYPGLRTLKIVHNWFFSVFATKLDLD